MENIGEKKLIRKGKVKEVYDIGDGKLEFLFTDSISVFDKIVSTGIKHKGEILCRISAFWFKKCEQMGVKTHFIDAGKNTMHVKKFNIIKDYSKIDERTTNYVIPLEVIARYYVAGSFYERMKSENMKYGTKLQKPIIEFTTKFEEYDRMLSEEDAMKIAGLNKEGIERIKDVVLNIDEYMHSEVEKKGFIHVDGKKEFAFDGERNLVLIDTFGTPDEDRFWDAKKYANGGFEELSKEFVRSYYRRIGYYSALSRARQNMTPEPAIPPLPEDMAEKVSLLYISLYEKITGEKFR
ncbi:MAG: phosphoribosylaminoimidazolesuccinocarboxamide synthase [Candidatus Thermoplasmatota archaeon]|nr:phosphoribosylaminoimidazolesuccinocarboxamide synthase [Candidatus Thermoplasmatota archaeon]